MDLIPGALNILSDPRHHHLTWGGSAAVGARVAALSQVIPNPNIHRRSQYLQRQTEPAGSDRITTWATIIELKVCRTQFHIKFRNYRTDVFKLDVSECESGSYIYHGVGSKHSTNLRPTEANGAISYQSNILNVAFPLSSWRAITITFPWSHSQYLLVWSYGRYGIRHRYSLYVRWVCVLLRIYPNNVSYCACSQRRTSKHFCIFSLSLFIYLNNIF